MNANALVCEGNVSELVFAVQTVKGISQAQPGFPLAYDNLLVFLVDSSFNWTSTTPGSAIFVEMLTCSHIVIATNDRTSGMVHKNFHYAFLLPCTHCKASEPNIRSICLGVCAEHLQMDTIIHGVNAMGCGGT